MDKEKDRPNDPKYAENVLRTALTTPPPVKLKDKKKPRKAVKQK